MHDLILLYMCTQCWLFVNNENRVGLRGGIKWMKRSRKTLECVFRRCQLPLEYSPLLCYMYIRNDNNDQDNGNKSIRLFNTCLFTLCRYLTGEKNKNSTSTINSPWKVKRKIHFLWLKNKQVYVLSKNYWVNKLCLELFQLHV